MAEHQLAPSVELGIELGDERLRGDLTVGVGADLRHLVPVRVDVEAHAEPAPAADVRRAEEALGLLLDELLLDARRRRAPDGKAAVAMVVVEEHHERLLAAHEERRRAVAQPLGRLRQGEADAADLGEGGVGGGLVVHAAQCRAAATARNPDFCESTFAGFGDYASAPWRSPPRRRTTRAVPSGSTRGRSARWRDGIVAAAVRRRRSSAAWPRPRCWGHAAAVLGAVYSSMAFLVWIEAFRSTWAVGPDVARGPPLGDVADVRADDVTAVDIDPGEPGIDLSIGGGGLHRVVVPLDDWRDRPAPSSASASSSPTPSAVAPASIRRLDAHALAPIWPLHDAD